MQKIAILTVVIANLVYPAVARTDIYTYVDNSHVVHFTNVPTSRRYRLIWRDRGSYDHSQISAAVLKKRVRIIAHKYGIDPILIMAMIKVESDFMPNAVSSAGAVGLMQLLPSTARVMHVSDLYTPRENIEAGVRYFKYLCGLFNGNYIKALAAYNAGEKAVIKYDGIPPYPETQWYVARVLKEFWKMKGYTER